MASTIWSREDPLFLHTLAEVNSALPSIYKCGIMLVLKAVVFLREYLSDLPVLQYLASSFVTFSRNVLLLHGRVELY